MSLIERTSRDLKVDATSAIRQEARDTVLMLVAAIVLADNTYHAGEKAFVALLVDCSKETTPEYTSLKEYAVRWAIARRQFPKFIQKAVAHDACHKTDTAHEMVRQLQLIGNYACVSDGHFDSREHELLQDYTAFLDERLTTMRSNQCVTAMPERFDGWTGV